MSVSAIHQPNFFPWLGYFNKVAKADVFIFLDDAQHTRTGGNWSNRVRLLAGGQSYWMTAPVRRPAHGTVTLDEIEYAEGPWREKFIKAISLQYRRASNFKEVMPLLEPLLDRNENSLVEFNVHAIQHIAEVLKIDVRWVRSSSFDLASTGTQRLIDLTRAVGCDTYLSGGGAAGYQDDELFARSGIKLQSQAFPHPVYPQAGSPEFIPGLSIIDALMNCGVELTRRLVSPLC